LEGFAVTAKVKPESFAALVQAIQEHDSPALERAVETIAREVKTSKRKPSTKLRATVRKTGI
jgi:hypothetical protein